MHQEPYNDSVLAMEIRKKKTKSFFNYDANLTSVITMELNFFFFMKLVFLCDIISCDVINVKNFREI